MNCSAATLKPDRSFEATALWRAGQRTREAILCLLAFPDGSMNRAAALGVVAREEGAEPYAPHVLEQQELRARAPKGPCYKVRRKPQARVLTRPCDMMRRRL